MAKNATTMAATVICDRQPVSYLNALRDKGEGVPLCSMVTTNVIGLSFADVVPGHAGHVDGQPATARGRRRPLASSSRPPRTRYARHQMRNTVVCLCDCREGCRSYDQVAHPRHRGRGQPSSIGQFFELERVTEIVAKTTKSS